MPLHISLLWLILLQFCTTLTHNCNGLKLSKSTALLVFGDSAVDTGNNNYIPTIARSNHAPYGMNFPGHVPTGRYSDGKLLPDILVSAQGINDAVPPFLQPNLSDNELRSGVCFASAAAGFDDQTTSVTNAIPMSKQPQLLRDYLSRLKRIVGEQEAQKIIREAVVIIHGGTVDFLFNFYLGHTNRQLEFTVSEYQDFLLTNLQQFLKMVRSLLLTNKYSIIDEPTLMIQELYDLGCHKMVVAGLPPIGCLPVIMTIYSPLLRTCIEHVNSDAQLYNDKLVKLLQQAQANFPQSEILYFDTYNQLTDMIKNAERYGFSETSRGCCGSGLVEVTQLCNPITPACRNQSQYVFWDSVHPTEAAYRYLSDDLLKKLALMN